MGKFVEAILGIYSIFDDPLWKAENILTVPENTPGGGGRYVEVFIAPGNLGVNRVSVSGLLIINIYTPASTGIKDSAVISDKLDAYLVAKTKATTNGVVQFQSSTIASKGKLPGEGQVHLTIYSLPFSFYRKY